VGNLRDVGFCGILGVFREIAGVWGWYNTVSGGFLGV